MQKSKIKILLKNFSLLFVLIIFFALLSFAAEEKGFKTAKITYSLKGAVGEGSEQGTEILYIDGDKRALEKFTASSIASKECEKSWGWKASSRQIDDGNFFFDIDLNNNSAKKIPLSGEHLITGYLEQEVTNRDIFDIKKEKFLDRECRMYEIAKGKSPEGIQFKTYKLHFYNGILLREEAEAKADFFNGHTIKEAVDIQFDIKIPKDKFEVPAGVQVTDLSGMAETLKKELGK